MQTNAESKVAVQEGQHVRIRRVVISVLVTKDIRTGTKDVMTLTNVGQNFIHVPVMNSVQTPSVVTDVVANQACD